MSNIEYKDLIFDEEQIKNLYLDNGWYAYTNEIDKLFNGIKNSTDVIGAYDEDKLVGLVRTISDLTSITYIQDILILSSYQRKGIGKELMNIIFERHQGVRQICLMTDIEDKRSRGFYESIGMIPFEEKKCIGFSKK